MTHIPLRMCVACRTRRPKNELIRITYDKANNAVLPEANNTGRGAYICPDPQCIKKAQKKHVLERHLNCGANEELYRMAEEMI